MAGRVKIKEMHKTVGDMNINGMFSEMMGMKDADPEIIIPKFIFVREKLVYIGKILTQFCSMIGRGFTQFEPQLSEIQKFITDMTVENELTSEPEDDEKYEGLAKEIINGKYKKLKENSYVKTMVILCRELQRYKSNSENSTDIKENFINQEPGLTFILFSFSKFDFKKLWAHPNVTPMVKRYVMTVFDKLYTESHAIYKCITSPDVDVDKFTDMLMGAIADLKKQPRLHRCKNAFRRIEQSVELLRDKFDDYYRESVASENEQMLIMNFITDVSNQGGANSSLAMEFRTIINYMNEMGNKSGKNKDPQVQKIYQMLNKNFEMMDAHTKPEETPAEKSQEIDPTELTPEDVTSEKEAKRLEKQTAKSTKKHK